MQIHLVTLTNKSEHPNVKNLLNSINKDIPKSCLHVIRDYDNNLKNLSKIYKTLDYLQNCDTIADDDIICVVDGHDVLFNNKSHNIGDVIPQFIELDVDVVISTENKCSHHTPVAVEYFCSTLEHRYLNSGVTIAYKDKYITLLSDIVKNITTLNSPPRTSDQRVIGQYLATRHHNLPVRVHLDTSDTFASTLNSSTNITYSDIKSFFVHVTFLASSSQQQKYISFLQYIR
jgi:hypothetical protein